MIGKKYFFHIFLNKLKEIININSTLLDFASYDFMSLELIPETKEI